MRPGQVYSKQKEIRAELSARYPVSRSSVAPGLRGSLAPMGSLNWASGLNAKLHLTVSQSCCYGHFHLVSSPVVCLCDTPGVVRRPSSVSSLAT